MASADFARRSPATPDREHEYDLCQRVARGDRRAAEALARSLIPIVRPIARRLTRSSADAQDAAQIALVECLRCAGSFRGEGQLGRWSARIAMCAIARWIGRHQARHWVEPFERDDRTTAPESTALIDELPRTLDSYLDQLPPAQRTALVLRHSLGCTLPEISQMTDSPLPTVKSRINTALSRIRQLIRRDLRFGGQEQNT